jgi:hypothetical protein
VALRSEINRVLEVDLASYFDSLERPKLMEMLRLRIAEYTEPESGVAQGSILSPLFADRISAGILSRLDGRPGRPPRVQLDDSRGAKPDRPAAVPDNSYGWSFVRRASKRLAQGPFATTHCRSGAPTYTSTNDSAGHKPVIVE